MISYSSLKVTPVTYQTCCFHCFLLLRSTYVTIGPGATDVSSSLKLKQIKLSNWEEKPHRGAEPDDGSSLSCAQIKHLYTQPSALTQKTISPEKALP